MIATGTRGQSRLRQCNCHEQRAWAACHQPKMHVSADLRIAALLLVALLAACGPTAMAETLAERDDRLLDKIFADMPAQRPGHPDLYVLGFAGDGHQDVFRNEVAYLASLASKRFDARGRIVSLVNHPDSFGNAPQPLATLKNLQQALSRLHAVMDPDEDLLLLFLTMHGTEDHALVLQLYPIVDSKIYPEDLRAALDNAGIRNRIVVISACYSGGFLSALRDPDTLAISSARGDRTSFGCDDASVVTDFGRAFLVNGLNESNDFVAAYNSATRQVDLWEREENLTPSLPQMFVGKSIGKALHAWRRTLPVTPAMPYPYDLPSLQHTGDAAALEQVVEQIDQ